VRAALPQVTSTRGGSSGGRSVTAKPRGASTPPRGRPVPDLEERGEERTMGPVERMRGRTPALPASRAPPLEVEVGRSVPHQGRQIVPCRDLPRPPLEEADLGVQQADCRERGSTGGTRRFESGSARVRDFTPARLRLPSVSTPRSSRVRCTMPQPRDMRERFCGVEGLWSGDLPTTKMPLVVFQM